MCSRCRLAAPPGEEIGVFHKKVRAAQTGTGMRRARACLHRPGNFLAPNPARHGSATQTACGKIRFLAEQACAELQIILTRRRSCNFSAAGCGAAERNPLWQNFARTHGPCRTKFSVLASLGMIFCTACKLWKLPMPSQLAAEFPARRFSKVSNSFPRRPGEILNNFRSPRFFTEPSVRLPQGCGFSGRNGHSASITRGS